ncbi:bifunctional protein FolD 1, mitochondrial-like isoform X1 [Gastrolobium bilobum]|uniref:bifunctional protein FolD 1, mitochondrial-like isoform X1 n=1 Tax=Gastrolobium bilobum TaxID=150636 RepID=UPI002AB24564|nr:bifunctional protein FolD 1, mitochondrial-like isoform X1 [Gastrolobium bilobum]
MTSIMGLVAVTWLNCLRKRLPLKTRFLHTLKDDGGQLGQILMSPPLASLDLPDIWTPNSSCQSIPVMHKRSNEKAAVVLDGKLISTEIRSKITGEVRKMKKCLGKVPGLAVILVGQRRDSQTYVRNKIMACEEAGIKSLVTELPTDCAETDVLNAVTRFNKDPSIHGILVQLPLPQHLDEEKVLDAISLEKDVDGFHPLNMGNLAIRGREPLFTPCTPKGCIELLIRSGVEIMGKKAVVIGRSNIVGLPTSLLFQRHHATVTVIHAFTENPEQITSEADIVVSAAGVPHLVRGNWIKPGATVIDVGTSPVEDLSCEDGYRLIGDVCYEEAIKVASLITPVPGGVGPMTVAMLLFNTLDSAKRMLNFT